MYTVILYDTTNRQYSTGAAYTYIVEVVAVGKYKCYKLHKLNYDYITM